MAPQSSDALERVAHYSLMNALRGRRSRRFGRGMRIDAGPLAYASQHPPQPLSEAEEAVLAFAACGLTGYDLADLSYGPGQGGSMLAGLLGRTIASPDSVNAVSLVITNDDATYLLKRPVDFPLTEIPDLIRLDREGRLLEMYRRSRVKIADGRCAPPVEPGYNFNINKWSLYAKGGTYFIPIESMTGAYINVLLEVFDPTMGLFGIDERNFFRPAGIGKFAKSRGGALDDDLTGGRVFTVQAIEMALAESVAVEQGMLLQNLGLMAQAMGLGGFSNYARHEYSWFEALGFRMGQLPGSRYVGAPRILSFILGLLGRDQPYPYPLGLERDGEVWLKPYCPPYYPSMKAAVEAFVEYKFGPQGVYRDKQAATDWKHPDAVRSQIAPPSQSAIDATIAYCEYLYNRYGRFPVYSAPFRTVIGYQATHVDVEFYDRFYRLEALTETQRQHQALWHA